MQSKLMDMPEMYVEEDQVTPKLVPTLKLSTIGIVLLELSMKAKTTEVT